MTIAVSRNGQWWETPTIGAPIIGRSADPHVATRVLDTLARTLVGAPRDTLTDTATDTLTDTPDAMTRNALDAQGDGDLNATIGDAETSRSAAPLGMPGQPEMDSSLVNTPVAVGVLGFEPDSEAVFHVVYGGEFSLVPTSGPLPAILTSHEQPTPVDYAMKVERALHALATQAGLDKVVLGRWLRVTANHDISAIDLASALAHHNHTSTVMAVPLVTAVRAGTLVTASPELLIARRGDQIVSRPLAGSAVRSADPTEDRRRADALLQDKKNLYEHALVVEAIQEALEPLCAHVRAPERPTLVGTGSMWHLATEISGQLLPDIADDWSVLRLAQLLHPTPAVAGTPRDTAFRLITEIEDEPRGPMTGAAGWVNTAGDGEFHVVIRAAIVRGAVASLFAGAGIVAGSVPVDEATETGAKLSTVLRAFEH